MSEQGLETIETTVRKTHEWITAIAEVSHLEKRDAYKALRAVLQTLRDRLPIDDSAHFAAELPMLVRGLFYEGWRPSDLPVKMNREQFLAMISSKIVSDRFIDPVRITADVLSVVGRFISPGEVEKLRHILPNDLRDLWPASPATTNP
jgi:uncharacterized protein (DUF2267 family)